MLSTWFNNIISINYYIYCWESWVNVRNTFSKRYMSLRFLFNWNELFLSERELILRIQLVASVFSLSATENLLMECSNFLSRCKRSSHKMVEIFDSKIATKTLVKFWSQKTYLDIFLMFNISPNVDVQITKSSFHQKHISKRQANFIVPLYFSTLSFTTS